MRYTPNFAVVIDYIDVNKDPESCVLQSFLFSHLSASRSLLLPVLSTNLGRSFPIVKATVVQAAEQADLARMAVRPSHLATTIKQSAAINAATTQPTNAWKKRVSLGRNVKSVQFAGPEECVTKTACAWKDAPSGAHHNPADTQIPTTYVRYVTQRWVLAGPQTRTRRVQQTAYATQMENAPGHPQSPLVQDIPAE